MITLEQTKSKSPHHRYQIRIDDQVFRNDRSTTKRGPLTIFPSGSSVDIEVDDLRLAKSISDHTFKEIPSKIRHLSFLDFDVGFRSDMIRAFNYVVILQKPKQSLQLEFFLSPKTSVNRKESFSQIELFVELYRRLRNHYKVKFYDIEPTVEITVQPKNPDSSIVDELFAQRDIVQRIHDQAIAFLRERARKHSVSMYFDFPPSVTVACEQYLLYFAQFLKDLGVSVATSLTHEAGQVLFTVTPSDQTDALDNIKTALNLFLRLPSSPIEDDTSASIEIQRLESSVLRLRSDLKLAAAELQAKDATIKAQDLIIGVLNGEVMVNSLIDITPKPEQKEYVVPGILSLATYKDKGVEVNLGEIFRRVKRLFSKE
jgi:hypothetical protein